MQMRCLPMLFSSPPGALLGGWELSSSVPCSALCLSLLSSRPPFSLQIPLLSCWSWPAQSRLVCVSSVCVCNLREAGVERMYNYTQRQRETGVGPCRRTGCSDLAALGGKSQHRSTPLHRRTLIPPGESPQRAQKLVLRYMHTYNGPGALALANLQAQAGTSKSKSKPAGARFGRTPGGRARPGPAVYNCRSSQQPWKQRHPQRGRELPALPDPPRICICHTFLGACLSVSPRYPYL